MSYKDPPSLSWRCRCGTSAAGFKNYEELHRSQIDHARTAHRGQPWTITNGRGRVIWRQGSRG